jgi:hypothetical protein
MVARPPDELTRRRNLQAFSADDAIVLQTCHARERQLVARIATPTVALDRR